MNCLILDDEPLAVKKIAAYINAVDSLRLIGESSNVNDALTIFNNNKIDIVFSDIEMSGKSGIEFARSIQNSSCLVVFVSAHSRYALEGYELNVFDFLLKPVSFDRFTVTVERAFQRKFQFQKSGPKLDNLFVRCDGKLEKIKISEIVYISSLQNYYRIHLRGGRTMIIHSTLKTISERLDQDLFVMVHKSFVVNIDYISSIHNNKLEIQGFGQIQIGRVFKQNLLDKIAR